MATTTRAVTRTGASAGSSLGQNTTTFTRFQDIPSAIDIPLPGEDGEQEAVEVDLETLDDDPTELCTLLENEQISKNIWMTIALAYAKHDRIDLCISIINQAIDAFRQMRSNERLSLLTALCWLYLRKCRSAPRVQPEGTEIPTKDVYISLATSTLNDASRINPSYPPLFLARGVLCLLKASLTTLSRSAADSRVASDRTDTLRQAMKSFDDAHRASGGTNIMAYLGKARVFFSLREYSKSLEMYQAVLARNPTLIDPDPRIGIGCCLWNLNFREQAKAAWERSLELNPSSKLANILMAIYYLHLSSQYSPTDPQFAEIYKKAMTKYAQGAYKLPGGSQTPLICSTFANYFLRTKSMPQVEKLARASIENTDVNPIASDGWYLLARKEHYSNNTERAAEYYSKADAARGEDISHIGAKFGIAQLKIQTGELAEAKFRLEKLIQITKSPEAMTLLGTLIAHEVFSPTSAMSEADQETGRRKAIQLLEAVRLLQSSGNKKTSTDPSVLLTLARLYEKGHPEKSLHCLQQVEQLEFEAAKTEEGIHNESEDETSLKLRLRRFLAPQLLSNIGCFHYQAGRLASAKDYFQSALEVSRAANEKESTAETDSLLTTITFNLARTLEEEKNYDEARTLYEELLQRHGDYIDGRIRLAFIKLRQHPSSEGPKAVQELFQSHPNNLEVRALYGWYLSRSKKRVTNIAEDQEQRHYKHTLQQFNKHDKYALTGMGNIHLAAAREMRRDSEQDRDRRHKMYQRAVEFFDKALQLDPMNVYAAQGIGIALAEDKKDFSSAIQLFSRAKDSIGDHNVLINLGHAFTDLRQFSRSIENYMAALSKDRAHDTHLLACLGRVWLMKGRQEKDLSSMKNSLDFSKKALALHPDQVYLRFNVAFVQSQIAQLVYTMQESQRTAEDIREAATGLDEAIATFLEVAQSPHPPFPRNDIEQRASMGRNTTKKQLERALQAQEEYERRNRDKIEKAREAREAEQRRREEEKRRREEAAAERLREIERERERMREQDREFAETRAQAERVREEADMTTDEETGERKKRVRRKSSGGGGGARRRADRDSGDEDEDGGEDGGDGAGRRTRKRKPAKRRTKSSSSSSSAGQSGDDEDGVGGGGKSSGSRKLKKRKLETRASSNKKFKSAERVDDSDLDEDEEGELDTGTAYVSTNSGTGAGASGSVKRQKRRVGESDDEDEDGDEDQGGHAGFSDGSDSDGDADTRAASSPSVPAPSGNTRQRKQLARVVGDEGEDGAEDGNGNGATGTGAGDAEDEDDQLSPLPDLDDDSGDDDLHVDIDPGTGAKDGGDVEMDDA